MADALSKVWEDGFPSFKNLMTLVNEVGWFAGLFNRPPIRCYHSHYFITVQDYVQIDKITTSVFLEKEP